MKGRHKTFLCLRPKDIIALIRPILWLARLSGIAPFTIQQTRNGMLVKVTKLSLMYSYIALTVVYSLQIFLLYIIHKYRIMDLTSVVMRFFRALLATVNSCWYVFYCGTVKSVCPNFNKNILFATLISLLGRRREIADMLRYQQALVYPLPSFYALLPPLLFAFLLGNTIINQGLLTSSISSWALACYVDLTAPPPIILLTFVYSCQIEVIYKAVQNLNTNVAKCVTDLKYSRPTSLRSVIAEHFFLRKICAKINHTFGVPMLITNGAVCYEVTWCLYCVWVADEAPGFLLCITWAMAYLIPAFCSMIVCQRVKSALDKTNVFASEMTLIKPALSWSMRQEIREWDVQLRQLPLQFHARNFFDLNGEQIKTVVSVILTYTVILIQNVRQTKLKTQTGMF